MTTQVETQAMTTRVKETADTPEDKTSKTEAGKREAQPHRTKSRVARWSINTVGLAIIGYGIFWIAGMFIDLDRFETTDDAQIEQYISPINIKVPGYVKRIHFSEHDYVKKGDILLELDDRELQVRLQQAEAALKDALTGREVLGVTTKKTKTNVSVLNSGIAELQVRLNKLKSDCARQQHLLKSNAGTREEVENLESQIRATEIKLEAMASQKKVARLGATEVSKREGNVEASIMRAQSGVEMAKLQIEYATIRAPFSGWLGRRTITERQLVSPGQTVTYIIPDTPKWVVANFKESQIANLRVGQDVTVTVDAFKGKVYPAKIVSIAEATGSKYSLVPQDNSTGNFVKIQQRIPVKIEFKHLSADENRALAVGMMAVVKVP